MKTKKRSKWARILAVMLALTMVFCDQSVLYASDSMADPVAVEAVAEPQTEEPAAVEPVVEAPAPQAEVQPQIQMETEAPAAVVETEAPVVVATEAPAPAETEAPAPAQTEAPAVIETEAPVPQTETSAPATEAPAPETEVPATEAPAPETETPAETEAPAPAETEAPQPAETEAPVPVETEAPVHMDEPAETEAPHRENLITFQIGEGAAVYVNGAAEASTTGKAVDGKILFTVRPADGYTVEKVLVDGITPARITENGEYIIEGIQTDNTIVTVETKIAETEPQTEAKTEAETEAPSEETKTYTVYINHMLTTGIGRYSSTSEPIQVTENDLTDGVLDVSRYALTREGLVVSKAYNITEQSLEKFGSEPITATIKYRTADGWIVIPNTKPATGSGFRSIYLGSLEDISIVPAGQLPITFHFVYENGTIAKQSETVMFTQQDGGGYQVSYTVENIPSGYGFIIDNAKYTVSGNTISASYGKDDTADSVTITFQANTVSYQVVERIPNKGYEEADLNNEASYTDTLLSDSFSGKVGDTTNVNAAEKAGFTAKAVEQKEIAADGSTQVIVEYVRNTYSVKYDTDGGSYKAAKEELYESTVTVADKENPTKAGYTFKGWYVSKETNAQKAPDTITSLENNVTVYAHWDADTVSYTVVYQKQNLSNGYDFVKAATKTAKTGTKVSGKNDAGKFTDSAYYHYVSADQNVEIKADGSTVVYVKYDLNTYTLEFDLNTDSRDVKLTMDGKTYTGGWYTTKYSFTARLGEEISAKWPTGDNIAGANNFYGWNTDHTTSIFVSKRFNLTKEMLGSKTNNSTTTYTALWKNGWKVELHYKLQNADDDGYTDDPTYRQSAITDSNFSAKEIDGYTNIKSESEWENGVEHYYFSYDRNTYEISYYYKEKKLNSSSKIRFGKNINTAAYTAAPDASKCGVDSEYIFAGWYDNPEGYGEPYTFTTMPANNLALYAKWVAPDKKVTLVYNNGEKNGEIVTKKGTTISIEDPERAGFDFAGWYADEALTQKFDVNAPINADITIYANWKARRFADYTVKYETTDGQTVAASKTTRGQIGSIITEKAVVPTEEAYKGYAVDAPSKSLEITGNPAENVITFVYASPAELKYNVKYVYENAVLKETGFKAASAAEFREYPDEDIVKELSAQGYSLKEQYQQVKLVVDNSKNIVIFELELSRYQINYVLNGGINSDANPSSYTITELPISLQNPTREGYIFAGWNYDASIKEGSKPHDPRAVVLEPGTVGNLTFTAKWIKVTNYEGEYDGNSHQITVEGGSREEEILYSTDQSNWTDQNPAYTDVASNADQKYPVYVKLWVKEQNWESEVIEAYVKITPRSVTFTGESGTRTYNGTTQSLTGVETVGLLDGHTSNVEAKAEGKDVGNYPGIITAKEDVIIKANGNDVTRNYDITTNPGALQITADTTEKVVTITGNNATKLYNGSEQNVEGFTHDAPSDIIVTLKEGRKAKAEGTDVGTYYMKLKADDFNVTSSNYTNITVVVHDGYLEITPITEAITVTITGNTATRVYNGQSQFVEGFTHDAPSEISVALKEGSEAKAEGTAVGKYDMHLTEDDFEVTSSSYTNITVVVHDGYLEITPITDKVTVTITGNHDTKVYNGTEQEVTGYTIDAPATVTVTPKEGLEARAAGTNVGTYYMGLTEDDFTVESANYENIEVVVHDGYLEITPAATAKVTITGNHDTKVYNGTEQEVTGYTIDAPATVTVTPKDGLEARAAGTNVGTYYMNLSEEDFVVESANYENIEIVVHDGYLEITPVATAKVTITGNHDTKVYNGSEQEVTGYTIDAPATVKVTPREGLEAKASGTNVGTYYMGLSEDDFTVESANYENIEVIVNDGYLEITPITDKVTVTITEHSATAKYDGTAHSATGYDVTEIDHALYTANDFNFTGTAEVTAIDADTYDMNLVPEDFENISENFTNVTFEIIDGTLKIEKRTVTLTSATDSKSYDGTPLTNHEITVTGDGWAEGEGADYDVTGSQTYVGSSGNNFDYTLYGDSEIEIQSAEAEKVVTKASNYVITPEYGTLTVTDEDVTDVVTKTHDGESYGLNDTIIFTISVVNIYDTPQDITITEQAGVTITGDTEFKNVQPGEIVTTTAEYTITEEDILKNSFKNTAKATFSNGKDHEGTDEVIPDDQNPSLLVEKKADQKEGGYRLNDEITYTITVTNNGNVTMRNIIVNDDLTGMTKTINFLTPGASESFKTTYTVTEADILAGTILNVATATGMTPDEEYIETKDSEEIDTEPKNGHLTVTKTTTSTPKNGEAYALGETISYEITVTNDGNLTITEIEVSDALTGNIGENAWKIESLAPGENRTISTSYTVTEKDILAGKVVNEATAKGTSPDPEKPDVPVDPGKTEDPTDPANGHLNVTKTTTSTPANGSAYALGETISYEIAVTNDGNLTITEIEVTDALTGNTGENAWHIESLAPGESKTFSTSYTVVEKDILAGEVHNEATAKGKSPDPEKPDVPVDPGTKDDPTVKAEPSLFVDKEANQKAGGYALGEEVTYTIRVLNNGNVTISNITVTDEMTGLNEIIPALAIGEEKTFTTTYKVTEEDILKGKILNVATAKGTDPNGNPVEKEDSKEIDTEPKNAHVTVNKTTTSAPSNGTAYTAGEKIAYQITVTNDGNLTATELIVTDELTGNTGENAWKIETLAPGESKVFTAEYTVTEADAQAGKVINVATAAGKSPDPEKPEIPTTPGSNEVPTLDDSGSIQITKHLTLDGETVTAKGATFYVALYEDEAATVKLTEEKALTYDGTSSATVTFDHIVIGKTYYLSETDGNGKAITSGTIDGKLYMADFADGRSITVHETKGTAALAFTNVFMNLPDNFYKDARLTLTKKLLDADGKAKKSNETFYIGLFADAAHTQLTDRTTDNLVTLDLKGDSEASATVSIVISPTTPATLYIAEVDKNGTPVDDGFAYDVTIDNTEITLTETDNAASVVITNQEKAEEPTEPDTEEPTEKPTETEPETEPQTAKTTEKPADTTTKAPKTGDDTNIWFYVTLMMLAALVGTGYTVRRKRRTK